MITSKFNKVFLLTRKDQKKLYWGWEDNSITGGKVTNAVKQLFSGLVIGVDEICPEFLKAFNVIGVSCLSATLHGDLGWWQTGVMVYLFKKKDLRVCSAVGASNSSANARVWKRRVCPLVKPGIQQEQYDFCPVCRTLGSSLSSPGYSKVHVCLHNQLHIQFCPLECPVGDIFLLCFSHYCTTVAREA